MTQICEDSKAILVVLKLYLWNLQIQGI